MRLEPKPQPSTAPAQCWNPGGNNEGMHRSRKLNSAVQADLKRDCNYVEDVLLLLIAIVSLGSLPAIVIEVLQATQM